MDFISTADDFTVYPNPVKDGGLTTSSGNINNAVLYDAAGRMIKTFRLSGRSKHADLSGVSPGTYQLRMFTENPIQTAKIIIQ
ncbi:MAG: T9SS type A sorting domain-containing protein [Chitinophagaceae bacterium]|nr:T9SS type A sorting domain-containing protein [Chitinophagaceae bacterium]